MLIPLIVELPKEKAQAFSKAISSSKYFEA
jgi:hypothetical protein